MDQAGDFPLCGTETISPTEILELKHPHGERNGAISVPNGVIELWKLDFAFFDFQFDKRQFGCSTEFHVPFLGLEI